ncbi:3D domain-containing protein [Clostridium swellfunianum]|uniref:3D domain-containing protein n=1 Tax=Clostridium swellfunianum TaxID=1367462 RepID=UPI00202FDA11|nr:3D domain-containing protein [Clostridium swellfunianum]
MIKRLISLLTAIALLFSASYLVYADDNPQDAIAQNRIKFQQMSDNIIEINQKIIDMNDQLDKFKNDIAKNNKDINENTKLIEAEASNMERLVKEVESSQELANKRIRTMYISGYSKNFLEILLSSENMSDFFYKYEAIKRVISFDKKLIDNLITKKAALNESISKLNQKKQKLDELKASNVAALAKLDEDKQKLEALVKQFNQEKLAAAELIKENEEKLISHAISVVDSSSSGINDVKSALQTLNSLIPQLSTASVKAKAKDYVAKGNTKLADLIAKAAQESQPASNSSDTYKATYSMTATAYAGGTLTAMGLKPIRDPNGLSTIAVDPTVIPLGSKVFIPGYGYAIASDTGGKIKGNIIDLYMNSVAECITWGRRPVTLNLVAYPGEW